MTTPTQEASATTVRFGRRSSRGLLGLSGLQVACVASAAAVALPSLFMGGGTGLLVTSFVWAALLGIAFAPWDGRPVIETLPTAGHFLVRRRSGQTSYRARPAPHGRPGRWHYLVTSPLSASTRTAPRER